MSQENVFVRGVKFRVSLPSEREGLRRSLDERVFVRLPALDRLLADRLMRLPTQSRLRRMGLTRLAGRAMAAANRRDFEVLLLGIDPAIEYRPADDQRPPGMGAVFHGHAGYREVWQQMMDAFEDFHAEPEEVIDLGDTLLATVPYRGHGTGSGVPVTAPLFQVFRLRRELVNDAARYNQRHPGYGFIGDPLRPISGRAASSPDFSPSGDRASFGPGSAP